ncbi:hypothetical protein [Dokdonella koreensis]|uniref:hypothetical protein n=1 Tax=Dokdonella koreensis TaxID=323415 RepID=UPI00123773AE|nr:hypothetical protein [Dokdonella koreensis]
MAIRSIVVLAAFAALPGYALAQGTISSGAASYVIATSHFDTSPAANFTGVGTGDQIFEAGWWFRIEGDASETVFPTPDTQNYSGATATIAWTNVGGRGFSATKTHTLVDGAGNGEVTTNMVVTNGGNAPITLHLFQMTDWDVNGSAGTDVGTLVGQGHIRMDDVGFAEARSPNAVAVKALPFAAATDIAALLSDASVTNFDDGGFPFGPGDITIGLQWTFTLAPGASETAVLFSAANRVATPVQLQSFGVD